jgi:hypothetical protein
MFTSIWQVHFIVPICKTLHDTSRNASANLAQHTVEFSLPNAHISNAQFDTLKMFSVMFVTMRHIILTNLSNQQWCKH